jgi:hypothetical protein
LGEIPLPPTDLANRATHYSNVHIHLNHHTPLHPYRQLFACAGNIERVRLVSAVLGEIPLLPIKGEWESVYRLKAEWDEGEAHLQLFRFRSH